MMICTRCGHMGEPRSETPGRLIIEIVLWLSFILPGFIYSMWRGHARHDVCRACGSREIVPTDTPIGRRLLNETGQKLPPPRPPSSDAIAIGRFFGELLRGRHNIALTVIAALFVAVWIFK